MFASDSVRFPVADHSSAAVLVGNAGSGLGNAGSGRNRIPLASRSIRLRPLFGHGRVSAVPGARSQQDRPAARLREDRAAVSLCEDRPAPACAKTAPPRGYAKRRNIGEFWWTRSTSIEEASIRSSRFGRSSA
jgi:hypothetical protein